MLIKVNVHKITEDNAEQLRRLLLEEWEKQHAEAPRTSPQKPKKRRKRGKGI